MTDQNLRPPNVTNTAFKPQMSQIRSFSGRTDQTSLRPRRVLDNFASQNRLAQRSAQSSTTDAAPGSSITTLMASQSFADETFDEPDHSLIQSLPSLERSQPSNELPHLSSFGCEGQVDPASVASRNSRSSVRHLTCFWWKEKGSCRFSDSECLYAHHDTGHYTDPPRQVVPGEPALAGRKLDRAMRSLAIVHRSSPSLSSVAGSRHGSRPATPGFEHSSPILPSRQLSHPDMEVLKLTNDNHFLRTLVDQNGREKSVLIHHIEELQAENKSMKSDLTSLRQAQDQLGDENEVLQNRIKQLEDQNGRLRSLTTSYSAIGLYGRSRMDNEVRYLGGLLDE